MKKRTGITILSMLLAFVLGISGCGVSHKTPEAVVEALITEYVNGSEKKVKECYNQKKDTEESLQSEIDATLKYFKAHDAKSLNMKKCEIISEQDDYTYVYIRYNLVLQNDQEYPCIGTYMTAKSGKSYYVLPPSKITDEMSTQAAKDYAEFMNTDVYQDYTKEYEAFVSRNPDYETDLAAKL